MRPVRMLQFAVLSLFAILLPCAEPAFSQVDPPTIWQGIAPTATYFGSDYEFVEPTTLRENLHIPLLADKSQRGNLNFNYVVSSSGNGDWFADCEWYGDFEEDCYWELSNAYDLAPSGPVPIMEGALQVGSDDADDTLVIEASGQEHMMSPGFPDFSMDGTGIQVMWNPTYGTYGSSIAVNSSGVQFNNSEYVSGPASIQDSNGNYMSLSSGATFGMGQFGELFQFAAGNAWTMTDTLGRAWSLSVADPSICPIASALAEVWAVPNVGGGTRDYTFCYRSPGVNTDFPDVTGGFGTTYNLGGPYYPTLTAVILPDGTSWQFHYDDESGSTYYWGNLTKIHLPTGGDVTFTWTMNVDVYNPGLYADNYLAQVASRTTPDGTWSYANSSISGTTVTDPLGNNTVYLGANGQVGETDYYSGTVLSTNLVKKVIKQYQTPQGPLPAFCVPTPLPTNTLTEYPVGGGFVGSEVDKTYDSGFEEDCNEYGLDYGPFYVYYGRVVQQASYDYDSSPPTKGTLLSVTNTVYKALSSDSDASNYLAVNLLDLVKSQTVTTALSGGNLCAETDYAYDSGTPTGSGATYLNSVSTPRGNMTSATRQLFTSPCSTSSPSKTALTTTNTFYDSGKVHTSEDPNSNTTTYSYSDDGAYLTTVTNALSQSTTYEYDSQTGLMISMTDPNGQKTCYHWDDMLRPTEIDYPDGGQETTTYNYSGSTFTGWTYTEKIDSSQTFTKVENDDSQGRPSLASSTVPPATCSSGYSYVATTYDADGRQLSVSNPYCTTGDPTYGSTTYSYDPLGEVTQIQGQDGQSTTIAYGGNSSLLAYCATVTGQSGAENMRCNNGVGWLTSDWEDPAHANYKTAYGYDTNGNLKWVDENGSRTRAFHYDSLSRMTQAANPESGSTCYGTLSGSTCQQNGYDGNGNLIYKTDARGVTTTSAYDALNRVTGETYSDGTTHKSFAYDLSSLYGWPMSNSVGRLVYAGVDSETLTLHSYDAMGRTTAEAVCTPANCGGGGFGLSFSYNLAGDTTSYTDGMGNTISQPVGVTQQPYQITSSLSDSNHPSTLVSGVYYGPLGNLAQMTYVNGIVENQLYSPRIQPCRINFQTATSSVTGCTGSAPSGNLEDFQFGYGTYNNGIVRSWNATGTSSTPTFNRSYTYDWLNRLSTMSSTSDPSGCTGLSWSYDAWGNITGQSVTGGTCGTSSLTYNSANQITNSGFSYDAAGNLVADGSHTYYYDAENHLVQVDGTLGTCSSATACYAYDSNGWRAEKKVGSSTTDYVYDLSGHVIADVNGSSVWQTSYMYLNGQLVAEYTGGSSGTTEFVHANHLGSSSLLTDLSGNVLDCNDFQPFGEQLSYATCTNNNYTTHKFTGKERDSESGLDNFTARYYSSQYGRMMSPDPAGIFIGNLEDPQQLNLYSYVRNNPLSFIDPSGLDCVYLNDAGTGIADNGVDTNSNQQECEGTNHQNGGFWVNGTVTSVGLDPNSNDVALHGYDQSGLTNSFYNSSGTSSNSPSDAASLPPNVFPFNPNQPLPANTLGPMIHSLNRSGQSDKVIGCIVAKESSGRPGVQSATSSARGLMGIETGANGTGDIARAAGGTFGGMTGIQLYSQLADPAINIAAGSTFVGMKIGYAHGNVQNGLDMYGTGSPYGQQVMKCAQ